MYLILEDIKLHVFNILNIIFSDNSVVLDIPVAPTLVNNSAVLAEAGHN